MSSANSSTPFSLEGWREGREGGREGGREEGRSEGGVEGRREGGVEGRREGGKEGGREEYIKHLINRRQLTLLETWSGPRLPPPVTCRIASLLHVSIQKSFLKRDSELLSPSPTSH